MRTPPHNVPASAIHGNVREGAGTKGFSMKKTFITIICIALFHPSNPVCAFDLDLSKEEKVTALNAGALLVAAAWGIIFWDYGQKGMRMEDEKWFQKDSAEGGADKLGHFYSNYIMTHGFACIYESWDYKPRRAALYGALSSFGVMGFVELGDSFSENGFSYSDLIMNTLGSGAGYLLYSSPELARKIDFRIEYKPDFGEGDIFTDYEGMKFLMAVKLDGFDFITNEYLKYPEFHLGYYARGYSEDTGDKSRNLYVGIGINMSKILRDFSWEKTARAFNYVQLPFTYISARHNFNE